MIIFKNKFCSLVRFFPKKEDENLARNGYAEAIIMQVPEDLQHDQRIQRGIRVRIIREKTRTAHIQVGYLTIREFPLSCLEKED